MLKKIGLVWQYHMQNLSCFLKGFTSVCLRISTRYKAISINTYFDLASLNEFRKNMPKKKI